MTLNQYNEQLKEIEGLLAEYMSLVRKYDPAIADLRIAIESFDANVINITCEYDIPEGGVCTFGWFVPSVILFGDKTDWPSHVEDYLPAIVVKKGRPSTNNKAATNPQ